MNNVIKLSKRNDTILNKIYNYKREYDYNCNEGYINELGIVLGVNGKNINVNKSYTNMKGIGYKNELLEYNTLECVTSVSNNMDKYILRANPSLNSISLVINVDSTNYLNDMLKVFYNYNIKPSILVNTSNIDKINNIENYDILLNSNSEESYKDLKNKIKDLNIDKYYCVKTNDFEIVDICKEDNMNSILMINDIDKNLLYNIKNSLNKGDIVFIKENEFILSELNASIKYIRSKGLELLSIDQLVS